MGDEFDFMSKKVMAAIVETADALEGFDEPFKAGGITALEEFYFRVTGGKHFDWEEFKLLRATGKVQ